MPDFIVENFIIRRKEVHKQPDGRFVVYFDVYDKADTAGERVLFRRSVEYGGNTAEFKAEVKRKVKRLMDSETDSATAAIDSVLDELAGEYQTP